MDSVDDALMKAVDRCDIQGIRQAIDNGANVNMKIIFTPLVFCTFGWNRAESIILELMKADKFDFNAKNTDDKNIIHYAAKVNYCQVAELAIKNGVDPDAESEDGTPLQIAIYWKKTEMINLLLDHHVVGDFKCIEHAMNNKDNDLVIILLTILLKPLKDDQLRRLVKYQSKYNMAELLADLDPHYERQIAKYLDQAIH